MATNHGTMDQHNDSRPSSKRPLRRLSMTLYRTSVLKYVEKITLDSVMAYEAITFVARSNAGLSKATKTDR